MPIGHYKRPNFDDSYDEYSNKRTKVELSLSATIYNLGHQDIKEICDKILNEIAVNEDKIIDIFINCAKYIPERLSVYTSLLGLINIKNPSFQIQLVENCLLEIKDCYLRNSFDDIKFLMRFLADATNTGIVHIASFMKVIEVFSDYINENSTTSSQNKNDWFALIVFYCLPHCAHHLINEDKDNFEKILNNVQGYISKRSLVHVQSLRVWNSDDPHPQEDLLDALSSQIESLAEANWPENICWKLHQSMPIIKNQKCKNPFKPITLPDVGLSTVFPLPSVVFRMFDHDDVLNFQEEQTTETPILPGSHTIERFLIDDEIQIILESLSTNIVQCSKSLLELKTSVLVPLEYMIVENIFGAIFNLPKPKVNHGQLLFYGSLILQLCKDDSNMIPLILAQATEIIFERLELMKPVCIERFVEWFSYHLINFQIQWSWKDWTYVLKEDSMSARKRFICETLTRLVRFSYYDNIKRKVPKNFLPLLPPEPNFINRYANKNIKLIGSIPFSKTLAAIRSRMDSEELIKLIDKSCHEAMIRYETGVMSGPENSSDEDEIKLEDAKDQIAKNNNSETSKETLKTRMDTTPHASGQRNDNTPHGITRIDNTPNAFTRPNMESENLMNSLPRNVHDEEDDVVNYEYTDARRKAIDSRKILTANRRVNRPDTDSLDPQETSVNRTPSLARNLSPPREMPTKIDQDSLKMDQTIDAVQQNEEGTSNPIVKLDNVSKMDVSANSIDGCNYDLKVDVFMSALFFCGHKTISHTFSLIRRYSSVIRKLIPLSKIEPQVECLQVIRTSWASQSLMIHLIVDHMNRTGYIEPEAVIQWAYSPEMCPLVTYENKQIITYTSSAHPPILELYIWECLNSVLKRLGEKVNRLSTRLEKSSDSLAMGSGGGDSPSNSSSSSHSSSEDSDGSRSHSDDSNDDQPKNRNRSPRLNKSKKRNIVISRLKKEHEFYLGIQSQCIRVFLDRHSKLMYKVESCIAGDYKATLKPYMNILDDGIVVPLSIRNNPDALMNNSKEILPNETIMNIFFWLKGKLEQILLDHYDQFLKNMNIVEEYLDEELSQSSFFRTILSDWKTLHSQ